MIAGWMLWIWCVGLLAAVVGYVVLGRVRSGRRRPAGIAVANTHVLTRLPRYQVLMRRYRRLLGLLGIALLVLLAGSIGMSVRPASAARAYVSKQNRDIEFCLDVSGSMEDSDARVAGSLVALAGQLNGQRVGLTIFNQGAVVEFPLTDDASYVHAQLKNAYHQLNSSNSSYTAGTDASYDPTGTWIGDGLMTCVQQFDQLGRHRARSIVIATDNQAGKNESFTVPQAAAMARRDRIRVYALMPLAQGLDPQDIAQMRTAVGSTGGSVYPSDAAASVSTAARKILAQEAARIRTPSTLTRTDRPLIPFVIASVAVAVLLFAAWQVER